MRGGEAEVGERGLESIHVLLIYCWVQAARYSIRFDISVTSVKRVVQHIKSYTIRSDTFMYRLALGRNSKYHTLYNKAQIFFLVLR